MEPKEILQAEAAARASGGVVLGATSSDPDTDKMMNLAAAQIVELRQALSFAESQLQNTAGMIAALITILVESVDEWEKDPSGAQCVKIMPNMIKRAEGSAIRFTATEEEDGDAMAIVVILKEDQETFAAAEAEAERANSTKNLAKVLGEGA